MKIIDYRQSKGNLLLYTDKGTIGIQILNDKILHIRYAVGEFSHKNSLMVSDTSFEDCEWTLEDKEGELSVRTSFLQLIISKETSAFRYLDEKGKVLLSEPAYGGKTLVPTNVERTVFEDGCEITDEKSVDGIRAGNRIGKKVFDRKAFHTKLEFVFDEEEALYGLGSHEEGVMNLRGSHQYLYQQNMKAVVPAIVSTKGYGLLFDSYSLMTFHDDSFGSYIWTEIDDEMDYYFIYGPAFDSVVEGFRTLTGPVPMLPKWAFGYVQSKERYKTQQELIDVAKEYRNKKIPLDLIVLDWRSWTGELWGQKSLDPERFPDPEGMMHQLHDINVRLMVSIWPNMRAGGKNHDEMEQHGYLLEDQMNYNAFDENARVLYWKQVYEGLFSKGIDAWWCDCSEPFGADWGGEVKPEPEERCRINTEDFKKYLDPEYINAFSLLHAKGIYEGQRSATSNKRVVNLTRSSYAGQHRYSAITWSGDITAKWETLRKQIPAGLNFCITGEPYWTFDIGAFFVGNEKCWMRWSSNSGDPRPWFWDGDYDDGVQNFGYRELYTRWFQLGAFLPMFRSHGTDTPREVWRFGDPGEIIYDSLLKVLHLRYRLIPYIYSLAGWTTRRAYTMLRALAFDFIHDPKVYNISDQYMFGPAFMVNPVTTPMYYDKDSKELAGVGKKRTVYLPEGRLWYDFWTGNRYEGGKKIETDAPLDIIPLFVPSGSIIPMGPVMQYTGEIKDYAIELRIYRGCDGSFVLYEDEGDNYNYENGAFAEVLISWDEAAGQVVIGERKGSYSDMPDTRTFNIILVDSENGRGLELSQKAKTVRYEGQQLTVDMKR